MTDVKFGLHYFMWLHERYWDEKPDASLPKTGIYTSADEAVLNRHVSQIKTLGIDYVILHVPGMRADGGFRHGHVIDIAKRLVPKLKAAGLGYTLMIDIAVTGESTQELRSATLTRTLDHYAEMQLLSGMVSGPSGRPLLLIFSPPHNGYADEINTIIDGRGFEVRHLAYYPESYWSGDMRLEERNFMRFWQPQEKVDVLRGFASVIPGYNDKLYGRAMQVPIVPRADGKLLHNQFISAIEGGAQHVILYGWNEYIEATQIEPTKDDGGAAYELTKGLIAAQRAGTLLSEQEAIGLWHRARLSGTQVNLWEGDMMKIHAFVGALYEAVLGRQADPAGRAEWIANLKKGMAPADVVRGFLSASEAKASVEPAAARAFETEELRYHDMTLVVKAGDPVQEEIRRFGEHEPWVTNALLAKLTPDSVVVDIGANVGSLSLLAGKHAPDGVVYAIEAFPDNSKFLQENVRLNGASNVRIIPIGASDQPGLMTMFCGANTSNGAVRGGDEDVLRDPRFVNVPSITLDQLFSDAERLDLIKIDIEGHEPKALRGAEKVIRKHRPVIICEFSPAYIEAAQCGDPAEFLQFIFSLGYSAKVLHRTAEPESVDGSAEAVMAHYQQAMESRITHLDLMFEPA